jgi:hypothetical protein
LHTVGRIHKDQQPLRASGGLVPGVKIDAGAGGQGLADQGQS